MHSLTEKEEERHHLKRNSHLQHPGRMLIAVGSGGVVGGGGVGGGAVGGAKYYRSISSGKRV